MNVAELENTVARAFWWETGIEWWDASPVSRRGIIAIAERIAEHAAWDPQAIAQRALAEWFAEPTTEHAST